MSDAFWRDPKKTDPVLSRILEETWHVSNEHVMLDPIDRSTVIASFDNEGITPEDAERDGGLEHSMARTRLAAAAPEMARLLLEMRGAELLPPSMEARLEAVLRKAGCAS